MIFNFTLDRKKFLQPPFPSSFFHMCYLSFLLLTVNPEELDYFGGRPNHQIRMQIPKITRNAIKPAQNAVIGPARGNTTIVIIVGMMKIARAKAQGTNCLKRLSCIDEV